MVSPYTYIIFWTKNHELFHFKALHLIIDVVNDLLEMFTHPWLLWFAFKAISILWWTKFGSWASINWISIQKLRKVFQIFTLPMSYVAAIAICPKITPINNLKDFMQTVYKWKVHVYISCTVILELCSLAWDNEWVCKLWVTTVNILFSCY